MGDVDRPDINFSYLPDIVGHLSGLLHLKAIQMATDFMSPLDLTPKQFISLEFIHKNPGLSQKEIAHYIGTNGPMMVHILDALGSRGLVERVRSQTDRRKQHIRLTEDGIALLAEIKFRALEADRVMLEERGITSAEKDLLLKLLRKLTDREVESMETNHDTAR